MRVHLIRLYIGVVLVFLVSVSISQAFWFGSKKDADVSGEGIASGGINASQLSEHLVFESPGQAESFLQLANEKQQYAQDIVILARIINEYSQDQQRIDDTLYQYFKVQSDRDYWYDQNTRTIVELHKDVLTSSGQTTPPDLTTQNTNIIKQAVYRIKNNEIEQKFLQLLLVRRQKKARLQVFQEEKERRQRYQADINRVLANQYNVHSESTYYYKASDFTLYEVSR